MQTTQADDETRERSGPPPWLAPVVIIVIIAAIFAGGRRKDEVVENPLVDLALLTVGVFAFASAFRVAAVHMGSPGLATFFGAAPADTHPAYSGS